MIKILGPTCLISKLIIYFFSEIYVYVGRQVDRWREREREKQAETESKNKIPRNIEIFLVIGNAS